MMHDYGLQTFESRDPYLTLIGHTMVVMADSNSSRAWILVRLQNIRLNHHQYHQDKVREKELYLICKRYVLFTVQHC